MLLSVCTVFTLAKDFHSLRSFYGIYVCQLFLCVRNFATRFENSCQMVTAQRWPRVIIELFIYLYT